MYDICSVGTKICTCCETNDDSNTDWQRKNSMFDLDDPHKILQTCPWIAIDGIFLKYGHYWQLSGKFGDNIHYVAPPKSSIIGNSWVPPI